MGREEERRVGGRRVVVGSDGEGMISVRVGGEEVGSGEWVE